jgi:dihydroorotase
VPGLFTPLQLWAALSHNPAQCLNQAPPSLQPGQPDELILFDPQANWTVETGALQTPAQNTYYWEKSLTGRVLVR